jgi:uncharacterized protein YigE (DUF2233 family)
MAMRLSRLIFAPLLLLAPLAAKPAFFVGAANTAQVRKASALQAVQLRKVKVSGVSAHVVEIDLSNPHVRITAARARDFGGRYRTFGSFVRSAKPIAAITGTFFDTATGTIVCNLVRDGKLLEMGSVGHTLALDDSNRPSWYNTAGYYGGGRNWRSSEFAVSAGPSLVRSGQICLDPYGEGFSDPGLFRQAARTGLATTSSGKLLMVSVNQGVTLGRFARLMKGLGAEYALNLDGGSSTALYARGKYLSRPARRLTNVVMVTVRPGDPVPGEVELEAQGADLSAPVVDDDEEIQAPEPEMVEFDNQAI